MFNSIAEVEDFFTREITCFEKSAQFARRKGLRRMDMYSQAVADAYRVARAVLRTSLIPENVQPGDILTAFVATGNTAPKKLCGNL